MRRNIHIPSGQVNHVREWVQCSKSAGSVLDNLDDSVESLGNGICQARVDECQDSIVVPLYGPHKLFHWRQAASSYSCHPALDKSFCSPSCIVVPETFKLVFQAPCSVDPPVAFVQRSECSGILSGTSRGMAIQKPS